MQCAMLERPRVGQGLDPSFVPYLYQAFSALPPSLPSLSLFFPFLANLLNFSKFRFLQMKLVLITSQFCCEGVEIMSINLVGS